VFDWTDDPEALTQFIVRCKSRGISVETLLDLLEIVTRRVSEGPSTTSINPNPTQSLANRLVDLMGYELWKDALRLSLHMEVCDG
jgi:hypothetical protein